MEQAARLLAENRQGVPPTTTTERRKTMAVPPELMAALQAGGGPPAADPMADTGGPPGPDALVGGPPPPGARGRSGVGVPANAAITSRDEGSDFDHIRTAILALQAYAEGNHDDQELVKVHKCVVALQSILADHAANKDAALGTTPALKHVRRVTQGAGY
jgi:hypothetical protein